MLRPRELASIALWASAFAALGTCSRYTLRTTETRWQIAAFAAAAVAIEAGRYAAGARPLWFRAGANALSAAIVMTLVKFDVEPAARRHDTVVVKREVRKVTRDLK